MRVIFDVSVLGLAQKNIWARTGIFRVTENLLRGLISSGECELLFSLEKAPETWEGFNEYLLVNEDLKDIQILNHNYLRNIYLLFRKKGIQALPIREVFKFQNRHQFFDNLMLLGRIRRRLFNLVEPEIEKQLEKNSLAILNQADIFHSPFLEIPSYLYKEERIKKFLTIYDIIPIKFSQYVTDSHAIYFKRFIDNIQLDTWIICISEFSKNDFIEYKRIDANKVFVIPLAASPNIFYQCKEQEKITLIREKYQIPEGEYILSLNTLEPRKNIKNVIEAFADLILTQQLNNLNLVLVGAKGWKYDQINSTLSKYPELRKKIVLTGYVDDRDLAALYSGALVFVFPSIYEGFGLPVLEAMQCGAPVITSNTSSLPEVIGDAGIMIEPSDKAALSQSILNIYQDTNLWQQMSTDGLERSKLFSWKICVQHTIEAYKLAMGM
jgi:glycosyltransferase involved in cell wall biosynthesis